MSNRDELDKRETVRDATEGKRPNTLRGLNPGAPGADDGPPSSGSSSVVVPSVAPPVADPVSELDLHPSQAAVTEPDYRPPPGIMDAEEEPALPDAHAVYVPPEPIPKVTDHKTIETATIKVDPESDPRRQVTERKLRPPSPSADAAGPASGAALDSARTSVRPARSQLLSLILLLVLAVSIIGIGVTIHLLRSSTPSEPDALPAADTPGETAAATAVQPAPPVTTPEPAQPKTKTDPAALEPTPEATTETRPEPATEPTEPTESQPAATAEPRPRTKSKSTAAPSSTGDTAPTTQAPPPSAHPSTPSTTSTSESPFGRPF